MSFLIIFNNRWSYTMNTVMKNLIRGLVFLLYVPGIMAMEGERSKAAHGQHATIETPLHRKSKPSVDVNFFVVEGDIMEIKGAKSMVATMSSYGDALGEPSKKLFSDIKLNSVDKWKRVEEGKAYNSSEIQKGSNLGSFQQRGFDKIIFAVIPYVGNKDGSLSAEYLKCLKKAYKASLKLAIQNGKVALPLMGIEACQTPEHKKTIVRTAIEAINEFLTYNDNSWLSLERIYLILDNNDQEQWDAFLSLSTEATTQNKVQFSHTVEFANNDLEKTCSRTMIAQKSVSFRKKSSSWLSIGGGCLAVGLVAWLVISKMIHR